MSFMTAKLKMDAIYWSTPVSDGSGGHTFDGPIDVKCRWEDEAQKFFSANGEEEVSRATVFVDRDMSPGEYLMLGVVDSTTPDNPEEVEGAFQIRGYAKVPTVPCADFARKVWV